jgi:hypothetical protein
MEWDDMLKLMEENKNDLYNINLKEEIKFNNEDIENLRISERKKNKKYNFKELMEFNNEENLNKYIINENNNNNNNLKIDFKKYN